MGSITAVCRALARVPLGVTTRVFIVRVVSAVVRRLPVQGSVVTRAGFRMHVQPKDSIQRRVMVFGTWEPTLTDVFQRQLRPGDGFVDVGANVGYFSLLGATCVGPQGFGWAFEVDPYSVDTIRRNAVLNEMTNIDVRHQGISNRHEVLYLQRGPASNSMLTTAGPNRLSQDAEAIGALPLDALADGPLVGRIRLVKIDVEGAEHRVVEGMKIFLSKIHMDALVAIEIAPHRLPNRLADARAIFRTMEQLGFHAFTIENRYSLAEYIQPRVPAVLTAVDEPLDDQADYIFRRSAAPLPPLQATRQRSGSAGLP